MADDDILSVAQVAADFGVTPQTVRSWIASGKLKAGRIGKSFHILRGDVKAMLEQASSRVGNSPSARVVLSGDVSGAYVVEKQLEDGRLVVRPDATA